MRSKLLILIFVLSVSSFSSCARFSKESVKKEISPQPQATPQPTSRFPTPAGLVNDYANVLDANSKTRLDTLLTRLKTRGNVEFAVVTLDSTKGEPISDYSLALARDWGVGTRDTTNGGGILLLLAVKDREWRIQVSRSLEKDLSDDVCKKLGDESVPLYKKNDYAGGIEKYVISIIRRLEQTRGKSLI